MKGKILITGASGFVGGHLVHHALAEGFEVYAGLRSSSSREGLRDPRLKHFPFDIEKPDDLAKELAEFGEGEGGFNYVIHCAAITKPKRLKEFYEGNSVFTEQFCWMLTDTQPNLKSFIYFSSLAAQGPGGHDMERINENSPENPITAYGKSKLEAEKRIKNMNGLPWVILRPSAVYGPQDTKLILRVIKMLQKGWAVKLGTREQKQSFIYVQDLVDAAFICLNGQVHGETFVLADGDGYSQDEFYEMIREKLSVNAISLRIPRAISVGIGFVSYLIALITNNHLHLSHHKMREVTAKNWYVDISKAQRQLGFQPEYNLEKGVQATIDWYRKEGLISGS